MSALFANPSPCPSCGKPASGRFCGSCGAALSGRACPACGSALAAGARFCGSCGVATTGGGAARPAATPLVAGSIWPWALAGVAAIVALVAVLMTRQPTTPIAAAELFPEGAAMASAPLPDLTTLPARARFDTLYNRVMRASESGDQGSVGRFAPMALQAYTELDAADADARYHAAMLRLHTGDPTGAAALADTISMGEATHLFGFVIRGTVARLQQDAAALAREQAAFLGVYDAEIGRGRPEYGDHQFILNQFGTEARARAGGGA